jgi:hypothetical protein
MGRFTLSILLAFVLLAGSFNHAWTATGDKEETAPKSDSGDDVIVFDELGRLVNPCEAFYIQNPPPPGKPCSPITDDEAYDMMGYTPLQRAVTGHDQGEVLRLLNNKVNPNLRNAYGNTALETAASVNDLVMVRLLLKGGARADLGRPLAYTRSLEIIALLQEHGAVETTPIPRNDIYIKGIYSDSYPVKDCCAAFYKRMYGR